MSPLFETIVDYIPAPEGDPDADTQMLISTIDYNEYVGRIGVGKIDNGSLKVNQECMIVNHHDPDKKRKVKIGKLYQFDGLNRVEVTEATVGDIVAVSGIADLHICLLYTSKTAFECHGSDIEGECLKIQWSRERGSKPWLQSEFHAVLK